jgi:hypothetical protein
LCENFLNGAKANVTDMERGILPSAYEKHRIKKADCLLSNKHIVNEQLPIYLSIYRVIYTQYAHALSRPIILIDWSDLDRDKDCFFTEVF